MGSQLQLLGSACLLVAWKVREDRQIRLETILKYSNFSINADELLEWEMVVLARLHWNIRPTTSADHLPALLNSLHPALPPTHQLLPLVRPLLPICAQNYKLARLPASLQASVALLAALRPLLQMPPPSTLMETPPSSSLSSSLSSTSTSTSSSPPTPSGAELSPE